MVFDKLYVEPMKEEDSILQSLKNSPDRKSPTLKARVSRYPKSSVPSELNYDY